MFIPNLSIMSSTVPFVEHAHAKSKVTSFQLSFRFCGPESSKLIKMTQQWLAKVVRHSVRCNVATRVSPSRLHASSNVASRWTRALSSSPHPSETFMTGTNNAYVEAMYFNWKSDPKR